jgi:hypothetical protein
MRGIFYSATAILFIVPILLFTFSYLNSSDAGSATLVTKTLGDKLASYTGSINEDLPRASDIIVGRAVETAITYVDVSGQPLDNAEARLQEIMINGTIGGNSTSQLFTFTEWVSQIRAKGNNFGFNTNVSVASITVRPLDSYRINVTVGIMVNVSDRSQKMRLYRIYYTQVPVSVVGMSDPLYTMKTNGLIKRIITAPNITVSGTANFDRAVDERFYMPSAAGPSFLDRLEGRTTIAGAYENFTGIGLETVVDLPQLQANGLEIRGNQSAVDYIYFSAPANQGYPVSGSDHAWLRMDSAHALTYNITITP